MVQNLLNSFRFFEPFLMEISSIVHQKVVYFYIFTIFVFIARKNFLESFPQKYPFLIPFSLFLSNQTARGFLKIKTINGRGFLLNMQKYFKTKWKLVFRRNSNLSYFSQA